MKLDTLTQSEYPTGSEWRRWDMHVHTPESQLGTAFPGVSWDDYLNTLEATAKKSQIAVIGVTDYWTIDGYTRLLAAKTDPNNPRLRSVSLLIPNIEIRCQPATSTNKALNIHILVDPSDPTHVEKIRSALCNLQVEYKGQRYGCERSQLINFARAQRKELSNDSEAAYRYGIEQFKPSYTDVLKWRESEGWLKANSLLAIANGKDGISGLPADSFAAVRDELIRQSHLVFSGNPNDRLYYLGKKEGDPPEKIREMYQALKPCLHGSDAHDLSKLFEPDEKRYCWIKADPTFEGLRQTLWEPESRVHIGPTRPQPIDLGNVIAKIRLSNTNGWFESSEISLNSGLVAIIGEKGAGKTAIADLLAFASGIPHDQNSQSSFITKGRLHLNGLKVELDWASENRTTYGTLPTKPYSAQRPLVRYLSQDFVERLCSIDHGGSDLQSAIEEVVFSKLDEVHKEGFSTFLELRAAREKSSQSRRDDIRGRIAAQNREIERLSIALSQKPSKVAASKQIKAQIEELKKQLPAATSEADKTTIAALEKEQAQRKVIESKITSMARERRALDDLLRSYREIKGRAQREIEDLFASLPPSIKPLTVEDVQPMWSSTIEPTIEAAMVTLTQSIVAQQGPNTIPSDGSESLHNVDTRIAQLQSALTNDELNRKRYLDLQKQVTAHELTLQRINREIEELDDKVKKALSKKTHERTNTYLEYFRILEEDTAGLGELYAPMQSQLRALGSGTRFELSVGYRTSVREWLDRSTRFYDGRKSQALSRRDQIERCVLDKLNPAWMSGNPEQLAEAFKEFTELVSTETFMQELASPSLKMVEFFDWMYSTDHIETTYKIIYGGTSIENLSPGTRGIALLVLYLLMDEDDRRPLLIDQPEGNLDNASIYEQLVPYIRQAKSKRQIILVTHNPNLVVATDAEQIIVTTAERLDSQPYPRFRHVSGSLECSSSNAQLVCIRQAVCTLLEGGDKAFKEREEKYSIQRMLRG